MKKIIYLKKEVSIGEIIDIKGVKIPVTQELIDNNPDLFEIKDDGILKNYENSLLGSENTGDDLRDNINRDWNNYIADLKRYDPKLYYFKVLLEIANDLNGAFTPSQCYAIKHDDAIFSVSDIDYNINTWLDVEFSSKENAEKAIEIMGDKLKYLLE